jgi:hypothetical protein
MISKLRQHIETKIRNADVDYLPFPHILVEGIFPDEIYSDILSYNPFKKNTGKEWFTKAKSPKKTGTPYHARKQIYLNSTQALEATPEERQFWHDMRDCFLRDSWFEDLIKEKCEQYFLIRFGSLATRDDFSSHFAKQLFLVRHDVGYSIGPHTDVPTRVFTCIFSFADRDGFGHFGTELLVPKDPLVRCWGNNHYSPDDFNVEKVAPYKPNNLLVFFKTRQSFHSVRRIDSTCPTSRYGMQFQFYEPAKGVFRDLSEPELMVMRHTNGLGTRLKKVIRAVKGD